jgi:hypothetical protein
LGAWRRAGAAERIAVKALFLLCAAGHRSIRGPLRYTLWRIPKGADAMPNGPFRKIVVPGIVLIAMLAAAITAPAQGGATILKPADMAKVFPATVFYRGQSATTQLRNSGGVKFADGFYILTSLVDTSGYSTGVAAKYQAYFITEVPIQIGGERLVPGAYGVGFVAGHKFIVTDLGAHDLLTATSSTDSDLKRPMPLQVLPDPAHGYRLYAGREYVVFER